MPIGLARAVMSTYTTGAPSITYPTGGVNFQRANSERINIIPNNASLPDDSDYLVFACWVKFTSFPVADAVTIAAYSNNGDGNFPFYIAVLSGAPKTFLMSGNNRISNVTWTTQDWDPVVDTWYHIIAKNDVSGGDDLRGLWIDGVAVATFAAADSNAFIINNSTALGSTEQFTIGALTTNNSSFFNQMDGCIEQLYLTASNVVVEDNITKFYNNGYVDMGSAGTTTGLPTPMFFHQGSTQATFDDLGGSATASSVTVNGTLSAC